MNTMLLGLLTGTCIGSFVVMNVHLGAIVDALNKCH